jgi:hypothetical protein
MHWQQAAVTTFATATYNKANIQILVLYRVNGI